MPRTRGRETRREDEDVDQPGDEHVRQDKREQQQDRGGSETAELSGEEKATLGNARQG